MDQLDFLMVHPNSSTVDDVTQQLGLCLSEVTILNLHLQSMYRNLFQQLRDIFTSSSSVF